MAYHINDMESNGLSIQQIASNFMASPEFKNMYGENPSDNAYINALYQNVLGRGAVLRKLLTTKTISIRAFGTDLK